jgi:preprotein translocase subunit Sec63
LQEALAQKFDFEAMENAHVQRHVQLQEQFNEYRCFSGCDSLLCALAYPTRQACT